MAQNLEHGGGRKLSERDTVEVSDDYYESIAEVSPRAAILEAWIGFETTAVSSARVLNFLPKGGVVSARELMVALRKGELISSDEVKSITKLRTLRNEVVHGYQVKISKESAVEYAWLLRDIAEEIASRTDSRLPRNC